MTESENSETDVDLGLGETQLLDGNDPQAEAMTTVGRDLVVDAGDASRPLPPLLISDDLQRDGDLQIVEELGQGGMGLVQVALQSALRREVAIKTVRPDRNSEDFARLLLREARIMGRLEHPNIIPVHALGQGKDGPVVVMKRIRGEPWSALIASGAMDPDEHVDLVANLCNPLQFAHNAGVVHCDLKPDNVMVGELGEVYVLDWGVAVNVGETVAGGLRGTPGFMAPELARGATAEIDSRTDVYLLGACLHNALTGTLRHAGASLPALLDNAVRSEPFSYPDSVPTALARICNKACHRDPEHRFQSTLELREALLSFLAEREARALLASAQERLAALDAAVRVAGATSVEEASPDESKQTEGLFREARFGFEHVLAAHPGLAGAREGLQACVATMLDYELCRGNLAIAESLYSELDEPTDRQQAGIESLRTSATAAERRLAELEHAQDAGVGHAQRRRLGIFLSVAGLVLIGALFASNRGAYTALAPAGLLVVSAVVWSISAVGVAVWRRALFANEYNRRWTALLMGTATAFLAHRFVGLLGGLESHEIAVGDIVVFACAAFVSSYLFRPLLLLGVVFVVLASVAAAEPVFVRAFVNVSGMSLTITAWWGWRRKAQGQA